MQAITNAEVLLTVAAGESEWVVLKHYERSESLNLWKQPCLGSWIIDVHVYMIWELFSAARS